MTTVPNCRYEVLRDGCELSFMAEEHEVPVLRRIVRHCLNEWGVPEAIDEAQQCASELVTNVIVHVGAMTPTTVGLSMSGTRVRIEVTDPHTQALPKAVMPSVDAEGGRGMALVDAISDRWGVTFREGSKTIWCEIGTQLDAPEGHSGGLRVERTERFINRYGDVAAPADGVRSRLNVMLGEEKVVSMIADLLHWIRAHGCDPDEVLDRAQTHFEAELMEARNG